ncbi:MAG TPA: S-adenosylmethionine:tRNA ribosyltransferase-isomerase [Saprospiraceae bacterium]|nr:S-adenosylmethionine:tRNA ribosyltransferase-isomerase [Saprospiraceae bacterium]HMP24265.1 S-adenosylmethionine:tRNA ribosyltransferase-isomerase [Saprospiraceae bacterium]
MSTKDISIADYDYLLPEERIAKFPLAARDQSKLLLYENGRMGETIFSQLPGHLPAGALLVFNDTRVIHARLHFTLENGAQIEILCLEPLHPQDYQQNFSSTTTVRWKCLIGGNRKWKSGEARQDKLMARRVERIEDTFAVEFSWADEHLSFGELLAQAGIIPLPPYLNRAPVAADQERYQTIYARAQGSVAAPTAGLHFTEAVFDALDRKGIARGFVTLHVGAGTFKPVKADTMSGHFMHEESIFIHKNLIESLLQAKNAHAPVIPVGTTSMRTLESLYWYGVQLLQNPAAAFRIPQWLPYENTAEVSATEALQALQAHLDANGQETLEGDTQLLIAPGYRMGLTDGLITNFHQPRSTLLLLVAALIGANWRQVYDYALENDFRFLSYGDSSLLLPAQGRA